MKKREVSRAVFQLQRKCTRECDNGTGEAITDGKLTWNNDAISSMT